MTKTELYNNVTSTLETILNNNKHSKALSEALYEMIDSQLKPRTNSSKHPAKLDDDGNIIEAYCRYTQKYHPAEDMVISNGKSKGYSKSAISLWNQAQRRIKVLSSDFVSMDDLASKSAQQLKDSINTLKALAIDPAAHQDGSLADAVELS